VHHGGAFNPYNKKHYSGGSSAGSAVAVALGLAPVAIGFDGGGSIRTPASLSGVVGLATGYGRLPFSSHYGGTMIKAGPLAATIGDAALAYAVMAREDDRATFYSEMYDGGVIGPPTAHLGSLAKGTRDLSNVTLGIFEEWFNDSNPAVRQACQDAVDALQKRGATVQKVNIPNLGWLRLSHAMKISSEFAVGWDKPFHDTTSNDNLEPNTRITVALGSTSTALEVTSAEKLRRFAFDHVHAIFDSGVDAIVTPTVGVSAPALTEAIKERGESNTPMNVEFLKYVFLGNLCGLPGISVPVGVDATNAGLPIGLMLTGAQWAEDKLLRIGAAVEEDAVMKPPTDVVDLLA
jgi:Asp-tRNA(Asn)/Glu-tRNA(Gln) amidotransferase A subunit family amidase